MFSKYFQRVFKAFSGIFKVFSKSLQSVFEVYSNCFSACFQRVFKVLIITYKWLAKITKDRMERLILSCG